MNQSLKTVKSAIPTKAIGFILLTLLISVAPFDAKAKAEATSWQTVFAQPITTTYSFLDYTTVTDVIEIAQGGSNLEIRLSNTGNSNSVTIGKVTVAVERSLSQQVSSFIPVTFNQSSSLRLQPNELKTSDPINVSVPNDSYIFISIYFPYYSVVPAANYPNNEIGAFVAPNYSGDLTSSLSSNSTGSNLSFLVDAIEVQNSNPTTIDIIGDNLSAPGQISSWPTIAQELLSNSAPVAIINESVDGATLEGATTSISYGTSLANRIDNDVISLPGVKYVLIQLGYNDIVNYNQSINSLESQYKDVIQQLVANNISVILATIQPGANLTQNQIQEIKSLNNWIKTNNKNYIVFNLEFLADIYNGSCSKQTVFSQFVNTNGNLNSIAKLVVAQEFLRLVHLLKQNLVTLTYPITKNCLSYSHRSFHKAISVNKPNKSNKIHLSRAIKAYVILGAILIIVLILYSVYKNRRQARKEREFYRSLRERNRF